MYNERAPPLAPTHSLAALGASPFGSRGARRTIVSSTFGSAPCLSLKIRIRAQRGQRRRERGLVAAVFCPAACEWLRPSLEEPSGQPCATTMSGPISPFTLWPRRTPARALTLLLSIRRMSTPTAFRAIAYPSRQDVSRRERPPLTRRPLGSPLEGTIVPFTSLVDSHCGPARRAPHGGAESQDCRSPRTQANPGGEGVAPSAGRSCARPPTSTGTVYFPDGGDPQFVSCMQTGSSGGNVRARVPRAPLVHRFAVHCDRLEHARWRHAGPRPSPAIHGSGGGARDGAGRCRGWPSVGPDRDAS